MYPFYNYILSCFISFYEVKTSVLCQNGDLMNQAANCEIFRMIIMSANYWAKYSQPLSTKMKFQGAESELKLTSHGVLHSL